MANKRGNEPIDRQRLVGRHNPTRNASNLRSPMQVGNGGFAFGCDITGLQTFVPFATMSEWGWKNDPLPTNTGNFHGQVWETHGRSVRYDMPDPNEPEISQWLISNPNRMNLARIGLCFGNGEEVIESDLDHCTQTLDLWTGRIHSVFSWRGAEIDVETSVHPHMDSLGVKIESSLVQSGKIGVFIDFPYNDGRSKFSAPYAGIWDESHRHATTLNEYGKGMRRACLRHHQDDTTYSVLLQWNQSSGRIVAKSTGGHRYILELPSPSSSVLDFSATFSPNDGDTEGSDASSVLGASAEYWPSYWCSGGVIDLSQSSDSRWLELERRIVLSQYVMAVNAAGNYPPQESGLVNLGWYGKFHMEMNWFHSAYLALFNRWSLLYPSLDIYRRFLPSSIERAASQGYRGARWPKMTDSSGRMAPGEINALLIWQQPHALAFAELDYRAHSTQETLERWKDVVAATADFMADFVVQNKGELGAPLHVMSENTDPRDTRNPAFEIEYWRFGLDIAQEWWKRLGLAATEEWVLKLPPLPIDSRDGLYVIHEGVEDMWEKKNWEHPSLAGLYGWLPGSSSLDLTVVKATSEKIWQTWHLDDCWGWDFAVLAMNAARLGQSARAVDFLLDPNLPFDDVGLPDGGSRVPFPYLPACGSLLYAAAFMAAGWDGAPDGVNAPGFPAEQWVVQDEGLSRAL